MNELFLHVMIKYPLEDPW